MMNIDEKISLSEYDVNWETQFNEEKLLLQNIFPDVFIEHIGSTSVTGMTAKPIIDILIGVLNYPPSENLVTGLEKLGYYHFGEHNTPHARYYFVKRGLNQFNVHVDKYQGERWNFMIGFRNYLRSHPLVAAEYSKLKKEIVDKGNDTMLSYSGDKMNYIKAIIDKMNLERTE